jgi:hypothetical protein
VRSAAKIKVSGSIRRREAELLQLEMRRLARRAGLRVVQVHIRRIEGKFKLPR